MKVSGYLLGSALVAALGGLLFGFDTAVISGANHWLESGFVAQITGWVYPQISAYSWCPAEDQVLAFLKGFTVASALIGTVVGSVAVGRPADAFGRRAILFLLALLYLVTALGCALAWDWWSFVIFRFVGGLAVGGASVVSPMYIAEISPAKYRGRLVACTQFNIVFGILLAYLSNWLIGHFCASWGDGQYRLMFGVMAAPAAVFFVLLFFTPQSPRWLIAKRRDAEARVVLSRCGVDDGIEKEMSDIRNSLDLEHHALEEPFFCRKYAKPILLAIAIAAFNQLSGINALIYYTPDIFAMAGASKDAALLQSVIVGLTNLVFTMAAMAVIDQFGRKRLMLVGSFGYIISLSAAAYAFYAGIGGYLLLGSLLVFIASHAFGQGAVIWVFISEIFPTRVRARGQALGSFTHWIMAATISWTFPLIAGQAGQAGQTDPTAWKAFAFYGVCMVGQLAWVLWIMPETKGVSLEKIQQQMHIE